MFQTPIALHAIGDKEVKEVKKVKEVFQTPIALHAIGDAKKEKFEAEFSVSNPYRITCYRGYLFTYVCAYFST